jgi:hypothetical protein
MCISRWRHSGYRRYLASQERITELRLLRENASDLMQDHDILSFHKAVNQLAVGQIFKTFLDDTLKDDPTNCTRNMNALSRLSREALVFKKYEDALAREQREEQKAAQPIVLKQRDKNAKLTEAEGEALRDRADDLFGLKSAARLQREWAAPAPAQSSSSQNSKDEWNKIPPPLDTAPITYALGTPGKDDEKPNLGPVVPEVSPEHAVENSTLEINSPLPASPIEGRKSKIENSNESAICDLPSAISWVEVESSALNVQSSLSAGASVQNSIPPAGSDSENCKLNTENFPPPAGEGQGEGSSQAIENQKSDSDICVNPCPSVVENSDSEHCTLNTENSVSPSFPSPGGEGQGQGEGERSDPTLENRINPESSITSESPCDSTPLRLCVENSVSPQIENRKSAFENLVHPDLVTCQCCNTDLPPLLPDGQRPSPFCPKCRSALRHPATLKLYCPSCRGDIRSIWHDDVRTSDNCPRCYAHLPPPPIWPPLSSEARPAFLEAVSSEIETQKSNIENPHQLAHAE